MKLSEYIASMFVEGERVLVINSRQRDYIYARASKLEEVLEVMEWMPDHATLCDACPLCGAAESRGHKDGCELDEVLNG